MNKEEVIDVLKNMQQEMNNASGGLFERLKNIEIENGNLKQKNKQLKEEVSLLDMRTDENIKLQNNWNELKKWVIEQEQKAWDEVASTFGYVLNKMQELEQVK